MALNEEPEHTKPWVTVLSPTMTGNALFRTQTITALLSRRFRVQLIGFDRSTDTYEPLAHDPLVVAEQRYYSSNILGWSRRVHALAGSIRGDAIICVKPLLGSLGAGLLLGRRLRRPVIADIDDWERGFLSSSHYWEMRRWGLRWFYASDSPLFTRILDGFLYRATAVSVSNAFLQALYGGHWIPHLRTLTPLDVQIRREGDRKVVLFAGAPRGHKGVRVLLDSWKSLGRTDAVLRLAVPDPHDSFLASLRIKEVPNVIVSGPHTFSEMWRVLSEASVVVVPQDNASGSVGQLPMKLLDAMAAGKPIIASDICDAGRWLAGGAGRLVTPGSPAALADALEELLDHPEQWEEMGRLARARWSTFGSYSTLERRFCSMVSGAIHGTLVPCAPAFDQPDNASD